MGEAGIAVPRAEIFGAVVVGIVEDYNEARARDIGVPQEVHQARDRPFRTGW